MKPSLDPALRTYQDAASGDWTWRNPWRSPGHAPVFSPCGLAGGGKTPGDWMSESLDRHIRSGAVTPPFIRRGYDMLDVPEEPEATRQVWTQGSKQEVAWSMFGNLGGGYAYRVCRKDGSRLTEECFQKGQLRYASDTSWIQYGANESNRTAFRAARTTHGTLPAHSTWTRNPIPPCADSQDLPVQHASASCKHPQFTPPVSGLFGDGPAGCITWAIHGPVEGFHSLYDSFGRLVYQAPCTKGDGLAIAQHFQFSIIDEVAVPEDLPVGEYVLSFRLDAERTPQVWTQCADVNVVSR